MKDLREQIIQELKESCEQDKDDLKKFSPALKDEIEETLVWKQNILAKYGCQYDNPMGGEQTWK